MPSPTSIPPTIRRSLAITVLGWLIFAGGLALTPISFISLLMIVAGSPGTQTFDPVGFFLVVIAPPLAIVAGFGVVRRWTWGWPAVVASLLVALAWNLYQAFKPLPESPTVTISSGGTKMTTYHSRSATALPTAAVATALLLVFSRGTVRREFLAKRRSPFSRFLGGHEGPQPRPPREGAPR